MRTVEFIIGGGQIIELTTMELTEILKRQERGTFCWLWFETKPKMNKTGNPYFNQVSKITKGNILTGNSYQTRVQNETENPDFVSKKCNVGEHISKCVLHNDRTGKDYLQYEWFEEVLPKSEYRYNGNPIEKRMFESFMGTYIPNKYGVNFQSVTIDNIRECHMSGNQYRVVNPPIVVEVGEGVHQVEV
jgi:hypothetical protein